MGFSINPGQTKTLKIAFTDNASPPVSHPLGAVPSCVDTTGVATISPVGTQTPTDPDFSWTISCPAGATIGTSLSIDVVGVNPDGVEDRETYPIAISPLDDTVQQASFT